jgi:hypothetical protein
MSPKIVMPSPPADELTATFQPIGYRVGLLRGHRGDKIAWQAPHDSEITIAFGPHEDPLHIGAMKIMRGKKFKKEIPSDAPYGHFRYVIYCHKTRSFAVMNSDPEIIIEE